MSPKETTDALNWIKDELGKRSGTTDVPACYSTEAANWILDLQHTIDVMCKYSLRVEARMKRLRANANNTSKPAVKK